MKSNVVYVAFGDSLTKGVGASDSNYSFPYNYFYSIKRTDFCEYINLGKPGMSSAELLEYIMTPNIKMVWLKASDITVTIGGNDFIRIYKNGGGKLQFLRAVYRLKENINKLLSTIRSHNPKAYVMVMGLYNPGDSSHPLFKTCNVLVWQVNRMMNNLSLKYNTEFINPYPVFLNNTHLLADEVHPNNDGYKLISELFIKKRHKLNLQSEHG